LKRTAFFAADSGIELALEILSGHQYRLFSYLCFRANRNTGKIDFRFPAIAEFLKRSEKSLSADFKELRRKGVCRMNTAVNQHSLVTVEICDQFWPYEKDQNAMIPNVCDQIVPSHGKVKIGGAGPTGHLGLADIQLMSDLNPKHTTSSELEAKSQQALTELLNFGISPVHAKRFIQEFDADTILDKIEYVASLATVQGTKIRSRQSMLVYYLVEGVPVPYDFVTTKRRRAEQESKRLEMEKLTRIQALESEYDCWCKKQAEMELNDRFPGPALERKLAEVIINMSKADPHFARIPAANQPSVARQLLIRGIRAELRLQSFEAWCKEFAVEPSQ
jgi:hypothetical protein